MARFGLLRFFASDSSGDRASIWARATATVSVIPGFPHLSRYAPVFFFLNLGGFSPIFWGLTAISVAASILGFWSVYLLGDLITNALTVSEVDVYQWYLPALVLAFLAKEGLDFFIRRYGEAFATVFADHLSLRFWMTILNGPVAPLRNVAAPRLGAVVGRYVGNVRGWADDWFWGTSRRLTQLVLIVGVLYSQSPWVLLGNVVYLSLFLAVAFRISSRFSPYAEAFANREIATGAVVGGFLNNISVVRRLRADTFFRDTSLRSMQAKWNSFGAVRQFHASRWFLQLNLYWISYLATLGAGVVGVVRGELQLGFLVLIKYAFDSLYQILVYAIEYRVQLVQQRIDAEVLEREFSQINTKSQGTSKREIRLDNWRELSLRDVVATFDSPVRGGERVTIRVPELKLCPGARIGIVGPSGVGKSTVLNILLGGQEFSGGRSLDGVDIGGGELSPEHVALINSSDPLFNVSLFENISLGRASVDSSFSRAVEIAHAGEFLKDRDAVVGDSAVNLSAGQLQRVRIARGVLPENLKILLLDEPFNGIDAEVAQAVRENILATHTDAALVLVTHNPKELDGVTQVYSFQQRSGENVLMGSEA